MLIININFMLIHFVIYIYYYNKKSVGMNLNSQTLKFKKFTFISISSPNGLKWQNICLNYLILPAPFPLFVQVSWERNLT